MNSNLLKNIACIALVMGVTSCTLTTTIDTSSTHAGTGIPFYLSTPVLIVKEPIEQKRIETINAVLRIGDMTTALYPFDGNDWRGAVSDLESMMNLGAGTVSLIPAPEDVTVLIEESDTTGTGNARQVLSTKKYEVLTGTSDEERTTYVPKDPAKSFEVAFLPDRTKPFMLNLKPGLFGGKASASLSNGWQLTSVNGDSDLSSTVGSLTTLVGSFLSSQQAIEVAEISEGGKLALEELKQKGVSAGDTEAGDTAVALLANSNTDTSNFFRTLGIDPDNDNPETIFERMQEIVDSQVDLLQTTNKSLRVIGYVKKIKIVTIKPGVYDISNPAAIALETEENVLWQRTTY